MTSEDSSTSSRVVAVIGAGSIGVAFAVLFARAGMHVRMWDAVADALPRARADLADRLDMLRRASLLAESPETIAARVSWHAELADAVHDADLVQECAPERLEVKRDLMQRISAACPAHAVIASSSSAIPASRFADAAAAPERVIVGHPGNPPFLLPVIELVPWPGTAQDALASARETYRSAGMRPVLVRREAEGFVFNRLQGAVLREAYCLVRDGVATVEDIDEVMRSGLGRRWAFMGPFETVDLNTRGGIASHAEKMGPAYERMGAERGQHDSWTPELVADVVAQRRALVPLEEWGDRVAWRDEWLVRLARVLDADADPIPAPTD